MAYSLVSCTKKVDTNRVDNLCADVFSSDVDSAIATKNVLLQSIGASDSIWGNVCSATDDGVYFDVLTNEDLVAHISIEYKGHDVTAHYAYDTPEEWKNEIMSVLQLMIGEDVDAYIADTYCDYVEVMAQGRTFHWVDGVLDEV